MYLQELERLKHLVIERKDQPEDQHIIDPSLDLRLQRKITTIPPMNQRSRKRRRLHRNIMQTQNTEDQYPERKSSEVEIERIPSPRYFFNLIYFLFVIKILKERKRENSIFSDTQKKCLIFVIIIIW